jgi:hypothetical protein
MREVQARVRAEFGIDLVPETRMIGFATDGARPARGAGGPGASA